MLFIKWKKSFIAIMVIIAAVVGFALNKEALLFASSNDQKATEPIADSSVTTTVKSDKKTNQKITVQSVQPYPKYWEAYGGDEKIREELSFLADYSSKYHHYQQLVIVNRQLAKAEQQRSKNLSIAKKLHRKKQITDSDLNNAIADHLEYQANTRKYLSEANLYRAKLPALEMNIRELREKLEKEISPNREEMMYQLCIDDPKKIKLYFPNIGNREQALTSLFGKNYQEYIDCSDWLDKHNYNGNYGYRPALILRKDSMNIAIKSIDISSALRQPILLKQVHSIELCSVPRNKRKNTIPLKYFVLLKNEDLKLLSGFKNLEYLDLNTENFTAEGIQHLSKIKSLRSLNLSHTKITNDMLIALQKIKSLTELDLSHTNITDEGLKHLSKLKHLKSLKLIDCLKITDEGVKHIAGLKHLKSLEIGYYDKMTHQGILNLKEIRSLESLEINRSVSRSTNVQFYVPYHASPTTIDKKEMEMKKAMKELRATLPKCEVNVKR